MDVCPDLLFVKCNISSTFIILIDRYLSIFPIENGDDWSYHVIPTILSTAGWMSSINSMPIPWLSKWWQWFHSVGILSRSLPMDINDYPTQPSIGDVPSYPRPQCLPSCQRDANLVCRQVRRLNVGRFRSQHATNHAADVNGLPQVKSMVQ